MMLFKKVVLLPTLLLLFLVSISSLSYSSDKPLIVGSEQNYPPFALGLTDKTANGFTVELWRAVAAESKLSSKIRVLPFHAIVEEFKAKRIDVLINFAQSDDRRQFADFTVPHVIINGGIFVRHDDKTIHSEADLNAKRIIVLNADLAHKYALSKGWEKQLVLVNTVDTGFQLLASGQYDAMLVNKLTGKQTLEKLDISNISLLPIKTDFSYKLSFAVQKGNAELLAKINDGLALTKANGVYDALYEKWFGIYKEETVLPQLIKYLAPIVSIFLCILAVSFYRRSVEDKQTQQALQESEQRFRLLADYAPVLIWLAGLDKGCYYFNKVWLDFTGRTLGQEQGNGWAESVHCDDLQHCLNTYTTAFDANLPFQMEYRLRRHDGQYRWILDTGVPRFADDNSFLGYIGSCIDITERYNIEQELKAKEANLRQTNADLQQFAYIAAHHLQEPTRRLNSFVQRLEEQLQQTGLVNDDIQTVLQFIKQSATRQRALVRDIQLYLAANQARAVEENITVRDIVDKVLENKAQLIQQTQANVEYKHLPSVYIDRPRLYNIFDILLDNALRYGGKESLHIKIKGEHNNGRVYYLIADDGIGISEAYRQRVLLVFERLQVTDNQESTGIGLAIVRRIIESRGGTLSLYETPGGGLSVFFDLPEATAKKIEHFF